MLIPGHKAPELELPLTIQATFKLADQTPKNFTMLVFYRGKHCPICRKYLTEIGQKLEQITRRGINVFAVSMDSQERAMVSHEEWDTHDLPLAHSMTEEKARAWGLYLSDKRDGSDEPDVFSEPGLFLVRPDGTIFMAQMQSAPFTRPPIDQLLDNLDFVLENGYPARGTRT
ncbi:peroxiredoxin family protein [Paraurantiacibacter namhicola]|uniref:Putative peroxiredoxin n=1 Tax=Paraurantiacibacter namhicola TaxID=645517 RepID=A0A1C7D949_9SPHN|nr:peroxiredoxin family protein [Paraurantiacibacter namhicola]ANU07978.1 Putative peroxiredoxin [Paraurantiacibacter namhicola]